MTEESGEREEFVTKVISGDTFKTKKSGTIRLAGVEAPKAGEPGYEEMKQHFCRLIEGKIILASSLHKNEDGVEVANVRVVTTSSVNEKMRNHIEKFDILLKSEGEQAKPKRKGKLFGNFWQELKFQARNLISNYIIYPALVLLGGILWAWISSKF